MFDTSNAAMLNLDAQYLGKQRKAPSQNWSAPRLIGVALVSSGALWMTIFLVARALVV